MAFRAIVHIQAFRAIISLQFGVQSRIYNLALRAIILTFRRSEPSSLQSLVFRAFIFLQFGVQSHHLSSVQHLEPPSFLSYGIQSHHLFLVCRLEPYLQFRHSEPPSLLILAFRATIFLQFGVQSHCHFTIWRSKPSSYHDRVFVATFSTFRATFMAFRTVVHNLEFRAVVCS